MHTIDGYYLADVPHKDFGFDTPKEFLEDFLLSIQELTENEIYWTFHELASITNKHPLLKLFGSARAFLVEDYLTTRFDYNGEDACYRVDNREEIPPTAITALRYWASNSRAVKAAVFDYMYVVSKQEQVRHNLWDEDMRHVLKRGPLFGNELRDFYAIRQTLTSLRVRYEVTQSISNS